MSVWIALVVIAQFFNAIVSIIDKYIVTSKKVIPRPFVYAFYISVLSSLSIVVYLFSWIPIPIDGLAIPSLSGVEVPSLLVAVLSLVAGYAFFNALISLFTALRQADASDVVPVVGAVGAIFTFVLSYAFLGAELSNNFLAGFFLLIVGTLLVSHFRFSWQVVLASIHAGMLFAVHFIAIKALFIETSFDNGFFWSRFAIAAVALSMLLVPRYYEKITSQTKKTGKRGGVVVLGNKVLAGVASILVLKAIELGDVSLVQALGALQYVFLLIFSILFGNKIAQEYGENTADRDVVQKSISVSIIVLGFFMLFI